MPTRNSSNTQPMRRSARLAGSAVSATRPVMSRSATRTTNQRRPRIQTLEPPASEYEHSQEETTVPEEPAITTEPMNAFSQTTQPPASQNQLPLVPMPNLFPPVATWANRIHAAANSPDEIAMSSTQPSYQYWESVKLTRMGDADRLNINGENWLPWVTLQRSFLGKYNLLPCIDAPVLIPDGIEGNALRMRDYIVVENVLLNVTPDVRQILDCGTAYELWTRLMSHFQRSSEMAA